jgi:hypothetical protein
LISECLPFAALPITASQSISRAWTTSPARLLSTKETTVSDVRIEIPGDVLVSDDEFCATVLAGANRRTAKRYESDGLPFVMVAGRKYRPLAQGRAWLASRITARKPRR